MITRISQQHPRARQSGTTYKYRNHLPLDTTWIKDVADNSLRDAFQIVTTGKTYTVQADSPADKAAWIADINAQIDALIEKDPTLVNKRKEAGSVRKSRGFFGRQSRDASGAGPSTSTAANTDSIALNGDDSDEAEFLTPLHLPDVPKGPCARVVWLVFVFVCVRGLCGWCLCLCAWVVWLVFVCAFVCVCVCVRGRCLCLWLLL